MFQLYNFQKGCQNVSCRKTGASKYESSRAKQIKGKSI